MLKPRHGAGAGVRGLYRHLSVRRRRQFHFVLGLMLLGSLAELIAIGAVVPFLSLLAGLGTSRHGFNLGLGGNLLSATALFMLAVLVAGAIRLLLAWSSQRFVLGLGHDLAVEIQRRTLFQPYSFHVGRNSSEALATLQKIQDFVSGVLLQLMQALIAAVVSLFIIAALVWIDPFTAIVAAVTVLTLYGFVSVLTRRPLGHNSELLGTAYSDRVQVMQESLSGIRDVIVDQSQAFHLEEFRRIDHRLTTARANTAFIAAAPRFVIEAAGMVFIAGLALYLSDREGGLVGVIPIVGALALGAQRLLPMVQQLYQAWTNLAGNRSIISQVVGELELRVEESAQAIPPPLPFRDEIRFDAVDFVYPDRPVPAVSDITLAIPRGSRVALTGKTGSGKSTLADLLMGLLEPDEGHISVDGAILTGDSVAAWRRNIAHVPQSIFLADASIGRNIALGRPDKPMDLGRVEAAARLAQLDDFVATLPQGYETRVGERGVRLSGGQRQRLAIARAIYKDAPLLVLDEATSALDHETEAAVMAALNDLGRQGKTIVVIAHRRSTIASCDLVVRLDSGRLVEITSSPSSEGAARQAG